MSSYVERHSNVIPIDVRNTITQRYHVITRAANQAFWQSNNDTAHSLYVGSYGRGTAVKTGDIDILCCLPHTEFSHFQNASGNSPSRLLQALRQAILNSYPRTDIRADGQVVKVLFSDGMKFEVLPAFHQTDILGNELPGFRYPDSNMGGNWRSTNPKAEQAAVRQKNKDSNGLYQATCRHLRIIRNNNFSTSHLSGIVIDSFVYAAIRDWHFMAPGVESNAAAGDYERILVDYYNLNLSWMNSLYSPGSHQLVNLDSNREALGKVLNYLIR